MKQYTSQQIKNIAFLGHGGSGKTTLVDSILYYGKAVERIGKIADGTTVMDFDVEEKKRKTSVQLSAYPLEINEGKWNILDAPGLFDFEAGAAEALSCADNAIIVLSGKSGMTVGAQQSYQKAKALGKPTAFFIGKLDSNHAHFYRVISILTGLYGAVICPIVVPYVEGEAVKCYVDLINEKAYTFDGVKKTECYMPNSDEVNQMRDIMLEAIASMDEELMEKYFEGEPFTYDEKISAISKGIRTGEISPVFAGIQQTGDGVPLMVELLDKLLPTANECATAIIKGEDEQKILPDESGKPVAYVFKTIADPFVGKLSYFKVISGKIAGDTRLKIKRSDEEVRPGKVMYIKAGKQEDAAYITAGDIGCAAKMGAVLTGDTLGDADYVVKSAAFPVANLSVAVFPANKGDEEKIANGLARLAEEDLTIKVKYNTETKEQILSGLGEQHIDVIVSRLKQKFGVSIVMKAPSVAYRETIRKTAKVQGKYKKQSGGHGQYGDVWIEFEPCDSEELVFEEKVFGGAVPKNFFPAVEKGLRDSVKQGVLAGYPMVGVKATLLDGSYHPVDSSEMAFKTAASLAFKEGIPQCAPTLLEPIGILEVITADDCLGDVIGEINKRRGRVVGMEPCENKNQKVTSEIPISETSDFATSMRSITQGRATFTLEFKCYEEMPDMLAKEVIAKAQQ